MDIIKKNNWLYEIIEKLRIFLRPIYDNGSSRTAEEQDGTKTYEPIYSKSKYTN